MIHQHFFARFHLGDCQRRLSNVGRQDDVRPGASNDGANLDDGLNGGKKKTHKFSKIGKQQIPNTAGEFWKQKKLFDEDQNFTKLMKLIRWNACHVHLIWAQKKNPQQKLLILIWNLAFLLMFQGNCTPSKAILWVKMGSWQQKKTIANLKTDFSSCCFMVKRKSISLTSKVIFLRIPGIRNAKGSSEALQAWNGIL